MKLTLEDVEAGVIGAHGIGVTYLYGSPDGTCGSTKELKVAMGATESVMQDDEAFDPIVGEYTVKVVKPLPLMPKVGYAEMDFLVLDGSGWKNVADDADLHSLAESARAVWC